MKTDKVTLKNLCAKETIFSVFVIHSRKSWGITNIRYKSPHTSIVYGNSSGVDIPEINQVIMLRPTESPIVFVQQLGRGLRNASDKEFVVILEVRDESQNSSISYGTFGYKCYP